MQKLLYIIALTALIPVSHCAASSGSSTQDITMLKHQNPGLQNPDVHLPFIMLIDQNRDETPNNSSGALVNSFSQLLTGSKVIGADSAFLTSESIVYNFLVRNKRRNQATDACCLQTPVWADWQIYSIPDSGLMLFVQEKDMLIDGRYTNAFKLNELQRLPSDPNNLELTIQAKMQQPAVWFNPEDLKKIFKPKITPTDLNNEEPIWDMIIHGHGSSQLRQIAGIPVVTMQNALKLLNNYLNMGILYIETCYAGGINSTRLQFDQVISDRDAPLNLTFPVIIGSIEDTVTWAHPEATSLTWNAFFHTASSKNIDQVTGALASSQPRLRASPHAATNLPQIWVPGGYGFQTFSSGLNPSAGRVTILSKAMVQAHEDENRPIIIPENTLNVLVYPDEINVPVHVSQYDTSTDEKFGVDELTLRKEAWPQFPSLSELLQQSKSTLYDTVLLQTTPDNYPTLHRYLNDLKMLNTTNLNESLLYPKFIGKGSKFRRISLSDNNDALPLGGVMQFLRDAFINAKNEYGNTKISFSIGYLDGRNDISMLFELIRLNLSQRDQYIHMLEKRLSQNNNDRITLQNVYIWKHEDNINITFELQNYRWFLAKSPLTANERPWDFTIIMALPDGPEPYQSLAELRGDILPMSISDSLKKQIASDTRPKSDIRSKISDTTSRASVESLQPLARAYYLHVKGDMTKMPQWLQKHFAGVSVQDLIDHAMIPTIPRRPNPPLFLDHINNLDGLKSIPDIHRRKRLLFTDLRLKDIQPDAFEGLGHLTEIMLKSTSKLPPNIKPGAFRGLNNVTKLFIDNINIQQNSLDGLDKLESVSIIHDRQLLDDAQEEIRREVLRVSPNATIEFYLKK